MQSSLVLTMIAVSWVGLAFSHGQAFVEDGKNDDMALDANDLSLLQQSLQFEERVFENATVIKAPTAPTQVCSTISPWTNDMCAEQCGSASDCHKKCGKKCTGCACNQAEQLEQCVEQCRACKGSTATQACEGSAKDAYDSHSGAGNAFGTCKSFCRRTYVVPVTKAECGDCVGCLLGGRCETWLREEMCTMMQSQGGARWCEAVETAEQKAAKEAAEAEVEEQYKVAISGLETFCSARNNICRGCKSCKAACEKLGNNVARGACQRDCRREFPFPTAGSDLSAACSWTTSGNYQINPKNCNALRLTLPDGRLSCNFN